MSMGELQNSLEREKNVFASSIDYEQLCLSIEEGNLVEAMQETPGWKILRSKLEKNLEMLKHEALYGEEPDDPVLAKILRAERRAFGKAVLLIADHADLILRLRKEAAEKLHHIGLGNLESETECDE